MAVPPIRLPNGRGRHPTANVPGDSAAHRGTAAAASTSASVRRSMVVRSRPTNRRETSVVADRTFDMRWRGAGKPPLTQTSGALS
jgi:hypothetical protein